MMHVLLFVACLQQVALQVLMDRLHCPQAATHMAIVHADLSHRTHSSGGGTDSTAVRVAAGQMYKQLRGDSAPRAQQAGQPLQSPPSFAGSEDGSEWQVHKELDSVWDQHSGVGPLVSIQDAVSHNLSCVLRHG